jgi:hypothetical protein
VLHHATSARFFTRRSAGPRAFTSAATACATSAKRPASAEEIQEK